MASRDELGGVKATHMFSETFQICCCSAGLGPFQASVHFLTTGVVDGGQVASTLLKVVFSTIVDS